MPAPQTRPLPDNGKLNEIKIKINIAEFGRGIGRGSFNLYVEEELKLRPYSPV